MIKAIKYIQLFTLILLGLHIHSCDDTSDREGQYGNQYVRVIGYPNGFSEIEVSTRSPKNEFDVKLSSLYMLIFDKDGQIVGEPEFTPTGVPTFVIDRYTSPYSDHDQTALKECDIFLIGNLNEGDLAEIKTLTELSNFEIEAKTIHPDADPSFKGLVMIGRSANKVDLSLSRPSNAENIEEISMASLYAKVVVNLQVQPEQHVPGNDQNFRMISWEVVNAPRYATLGAPDAIAETNPSHNDKIDPVSSGLYSGSNPVGVSQSLSYTFYMLEHKRNKVNDITYPTGIDEMLKQRYKPKLVNEDTDASYMVITGVYTDHQGIQHTATYKLYLGANAVDDFYILRDNQYNNNITIKGVTSNNSFNESSVSFDARVTVNSGPIVISVKRDTQLDCHYEVRPLDIYVSSGFTVNVEVDDVAQNWIGLDREATENGTVVKRDYFTTNLVPSLPKSYGPFTSDFRVWAYFDENTSTLDRTGKIIFTCIEDATGDQTIITYTFLQKGLFEVQYGGRTYYIEFHEEYLHNFDPYDPVNNKTDGIFWGLDGLQLSDEHDAFTLKSTLGIADEGTDTQIKAFLPNYKYDFYTGLDIDTDKGIVDGKVKINEYSGIDFTKKIVEEAGIGPLKLTETANSAVEYCYNKNRRNDEGKVEEIKWYLPAIDEIEDIVMGAYGTFTDFQNKYYWSSQPAFYKYFYSYEFRLFGVITLNSAEGYFFMDNTSSARATKVDYQNGQYYTVGSGMDNYLIKYSFYKTTSNVMKDNPYEEVNSLSPDYHLGYKLRGEINRVRCVYKVN